MMKNWIIKNIRYFIGALVGGLSGFFYWKYIGCLTGNCGITSKPLNSVLYFAFFGALMFGVFKKERKSENASTNVL